MHQSVNNTSDGENSSYNSTDLDKEMQEVIFILPEFDSYGGHIKAEVNSRKVHAGAYFIRIGSELVDVVDIAGHVNVCGGYDLRGKFFKKWVNFFKILIYF
jgi:hypothetical protein